MWVTSCPPAFPPRNTEIQYWKSLKNLITQHSHIRDDPHKGRDLPKLISELAQGQDQPGLLLPSPDLSVL